MNQCIKQNNEETTGNKPVEFKIPDALLKELELYSAKDLMDAIIHMKNSKAVNQNTSYEEEQRMIAHEYNTLNQMFVCATRYLSMQKTDDEMAIETYDKLFRDFRQLYKDYSGRLDEYSKERFGVWAYKLKRNLLATDWVKA